MNKKNPELITPSEAARMLGKQNPEGIKAALKNGSFPIGMAYQGARKRWVYIIPRKPFENFVKTGAVCDAS